MQIKPTVPSLKHKRHWNSACTSLHRLGAVRQGRVRADSSSALGRTLGVSRKAASVPQAKSNSRLTV